MNAKQALETIISALPNKHAFTEEIKTLEALVKEPLTFEEALKELAANGWEIRRGYDFRKYYLTKEPTTQITIIEKEAYEVSVPDSDHKQILTFEEHQLLHKLLTAMKREESDE